MIQQGCSAPTLLEALGMGLEVKVGSMTYALVDGKLCFETVVIDAKDLIAMQLGANVHCESRFVETDMSVVDFIKMAADMDRADVERLVGEMREARKSQYGEGFRAIA